MDILQALLLGVVQGITEWLPVSSTAHLILFPWVLGWEFDPRVQFVFDVLVQDGTLVAVVAYFRRDLAGVVTAAVRGLRQRRPLGTPEARLGWWILLGSIPVAAVGLTFKEFFAGLHGSPVLVAGILLGATVLLFLGERWGRRLRGVEGLTAGDALLVGAFQALALFPGVSRSAATIAGGLLRGLDRRSAARFSFLLSIPALAGAGLLGTLDLLRSPDAAAQVPALATGLLAAAVVGYAAIHWLLRYLSRRSLYAFAWYRVALGVLLLALAAARPS